jgi:hypothetical protein
MILQTSPDSWTEARVRAADIHWKMSSARV